MNGKRIDCRLQAALHRFHEAAVKWRPDVQTNRAYPPRLGNLDSSCNGRRLSRDDDLSRGVEVGRLHETGGRGVTAYLPGHCFRGAHKGGHAPGCVLDRVSHEFTTKPHDGESIFE